MAKMAPGIFFLDTDHVDAPFQENIKSLTGVPFIVIPITSDAAKGFVWDQTINSITYILYLIRINGTERCKRTEISGTAP